LIRLAIAVAERVLRSELGARRDAAAQFVRSALEVAGSRKVLAIRVNPGDYELLTEHRGELLGPQESARLIPDPAISSWGCVVEVETGLVDARVESQLQEAARLLGGDEIS
jgi:flagellar assembly protein FliH